MAERHGSLVSFRPDIRVVDCTLRDGGLVNNFRFTDEFVKDLYLANIKAGVDYMEFGKENLSSMFYAEMAILSVRHAVVMALVGSVKLSWKLMAFPLVF